MDSSLQSYKILNMGFFALFPAYERLSFLSDSLGFYSFLGSISAQSLFSYTNYAAGLRVVVNTTWHKFFVEVFTFLRVCIGLSWFCFAWGLVVLSGTAFFLVWLIMHQRTHPTDLFKPFNRWLIFHFFILIILLYNMDHYDHYEPGFRRISFCERKDLSALVESSMQMRLLLRRY